VKAEPEEVKDLFGMGVRIRGEVFVAYHPEKVGQYANLKMCDFINRLGWSEVFEIQGPMLCFLNIFAKMLAKILAFLFKTPIRILQNFDHKIVFREKHHFSAENWQKS
jgi:hypothetical protein